MKYRIAIWATAGFLVAGSWGLYFASADKAVPISPFVSALARWTQPAVAVIISYSSKSLLGLRATMVANAVTYAVIGLIVETIRRHLHRRPTHYRFRTSS